MTRVIVIADRGDRRQRGLARARIRCTVRVRGLAVAVVLATSLALSTMTHAEPASPANAVTRAQGPAGALVLVEESHARPLVEISVATRRGSSSDPRGHEGLTLLAAEVARRGAAGRARAAIDGALDALGATLEVDVTPDTTVFAGHVLARNLDPFLAILADLILRPDFSADETTRTKREFESRLDELRTDDMALGQRYFARRLYGDQPYGRAADGTKASLATLDANTARAHFRSLFVGRDLIFAAAGDVSAQAFNDKLHKLFAALPPGTPTHDALPAPPRPMRGWRVQVVDKPDRQQVQIMFGQTGVPATDPDYVPLLVALTAFGGAGMKPTLMDEVRTRRGLAYGAYMTMAPFRGPGPLRGWVGTGAERTATTLKLVLRLFGDLKKKGLTNDRAAFFKEFLAGSHAATMDAPAQRLATRVNAELAGLPPAWVDEFPARVRAVSAADVNAAITRHLHPEALTITLVATARDVVPLLQKAKIDPGAIDVVPFDSY